ncbi:MAG: ferrous iron transport protein A [Propionibacteriaceae bacterium]|jgi:Fe2+ transport system protein FeoA|nr:ferrous iron transport protein A [Propionibacteriaceae bacterium]
MKSLVSTLSLDQAPIGRTLTIAATCDDGVVARRLTSLGWRVGVQIQVTQRASGGARIIDLNGSRVAVSRNLARALPVEVAA